MPPRRIRPSVLIAAAAFVAALVGPATAEAQRRGPRRPTPAVRTVVYVGYGWYPSFGFYDPYWYGYGPYRAGYQVWGPYPPYGYRYPYPIDRRSSLRLEVTPRDAEVYVDGYSAGVVDEFDGVFQRLHVEPGGHEITLYLAGYRTVSQQLYLSPGEDRKLKLRLEPLAAGETAEPPPPPSAPPEVRTPERGPGRGGRGGRGPGRPMPPPPEGGGPPETREPVAQFGTLALRVQPSDAEVKVDGEVWTPMASTPAGEPVLIQLPEGRHHLEISKPGLRSYAEDVLILRGRTLTLNVSLTGDRR